VDGGQKPSSTMRDAGRRGNTRLVGSLIEHPYRGLETNDRPHLRGMADERPWDEKTKSGKKLPKPQRGESDIDLDYLMAKKNLERTSRNGPDHYVRTEDGQLKML